MKSYQVVDFGKPLELREYENPKPQGREILVKISACGVCHSDIHLADGYFDLGEGKRITLADRGTKLPFTPGHEITGSVVDIGEDAEDVKIGDSGIVFPWIGCGKCEACKNDNETLCEAPKYLGARLNGGYSDHIIVPDSKYLVSYGDMDPAVAAPYACSGLTAYSALKKIPNTGPEDWIIIIGAGGVGINGILLSSAVQKAKILVIDKDKEKREKAVEAGAHEAFSPDDEEKIRKVIGIGASAAIDFVGMPQTTDFGLSLIKKGGMVVVVGLYGGSLKLSLPLVPMRSITLKGSYVGELRELKELVNIIKSGKIKLIPVKKQDLETANQAMLDLRSGKVNGRIVLIPK
jgi:D-arabinose 1-dehydrogenase-like Zn-dependent alcohol dehydrogenase